MIKRFLGVVVVMAVLLFLSFILFPCIDQAPPDTKSAVCLDNLRTVGNFALMYLEEHARYPQTDRWCDLLADHIEDRQFICPVALEKGDKGPCHYAINPQCKPDSPPDTVLLFETKGGWNQHGGLELVTTAYHNGRCCVLFNDGHAEIVEDPAKLNWGTESAGKQ
jgi:prepilin-type processing-associated H-X9-DG protein